MSEPLIALADRFPERRVLITGAASGLGLALAQYFGAAGWRVGMLDREAERLQARGDALTRDGVSAMPLVADVADHEQVEAAVARFADTHGGPDILVNNAGVGLGGPFSDIPLADWRWILDINLMGAVHACRAVLPRMHAAGGGSIVNVASAAAFISSPDMSGYNASKAALTSLSETLYSELLDTRIAVNVVLPAFFQTELLERLRAPEPQREQARLLMAHSDIAVDDVVEQIVSGMAAGRFYVVVPGKLRLLWWFKRLAPVSFMRRFKRMREKRLTALKQKT